MPKEERRTTNPELQFEAPDDDKRKESGELTERAFHVASDVVRTLEHRLEYDDNYLVFPSDSLRRIAFYSSYETYLDNAERKVTESDKWNLRNPTRTEIDAMKEQLPEFKEKVEAARVNANQHLRRKIASNVRTYDYDLLEDTNRDKQAIPARLRVARKDGVHMASFFAQEVREKPEFIDKLRNLAHNYDQAKLDSRDEVARTFIEAVNQGASPEANRLIYQMGELWATHARRMSEVWQAALERYNGEFPDDPLDPHDPRYALRASVR